MTKPGYVLIDALVAAVMLVIVSSSIVYAIAFYTRSQAKNTVQTNVAVLVAEGLEVAYNIYLYNWSFPTSSAYQVALNNTTTPPSWTLISGTQNNIQAKYTRTISVQPVCRSSTNGQQVSCPAAAGSYTDTKTKLATVTVSCPDASCKTITSSLLLYHPQ